MTLTPVQGQFLLRRLRLAITNLHTKLEVSTINCNADMKGNAKSKNSRFELPFEGLGVTHKVYLWLDGKRIVTSYQC